MTTERSLEEVIQEEAFACLLQEQGEPFFRLTNTLSERPGPSWTKKHFYQLHTESDELESFLDDYGARFNRTYGLIRELVASVRWFSLAGFSISHLESRFETYGIEGALSEPEKEAALTSIAEARGFMHESLECLLIETR